MPATMPLCSTRGSSARIRITSCFGRKLRSTETTRTLNGSGFVPWKTVSASPTIPAFTAESGMIAGGGPAGTTARRRVPPLVVEAGVAGAPTRKTSARCEKQPERRQKGETSAPHEALRVGGASLESNAGRRSRRKPAGGRGSYIGLTQIRGTDHHRTYEVVLDGRRARQCRRLRGCELRAAARLLSHDQPGSHGLALPRDMDGGAGGDGRGGTRVSATAGPVALPRAASAEGVQDRPMLSTRDGRGSPADSGRGPRAPLTIDPMKRFKAVVIGGTGYGGAEIDPAAAHPSRGRAGPGGRGRPRRRAARGGAPAADGAQPAALRERPARARRRAARTSRCWGCRTR